MSTTTSTHTVDAAGRRYLDEAAAGLDDLPVREREELVSDIADAVAELGDDLAEDYDALVQRLGRPVEFAREIRRSSGAAEREPEPAADAGGAAAVVPVGPGLVERWGAQALDALRWCGRELEPIWWVVRAGAVAVLVGLVLGLGASGVVTVGVVLLGVSLALGVRRRAGAAESAPRAEAVRGGALLGLGLLMLFVLAQVASGGGYDDGGYVEPYPADGSGVADSVLSGANGVIENVYAFDAEGNRIASVRLYDQLGNAIDVGGPNAPDPTRKRVLDANGVEQFNAFPIRYVEPGTNVVADPDAGWPASPGALQSGSVAAATAPVAAAPQGGTAVPAAPAAAAKPRPAAEPAAVPPSVPDERVAPNAR